MAPSEAARTISARQGEPKTPFYLTGQVGGQPFALHAVGERVILTRGAAERQEVDMPVPGAAVEVPLTAHAPEPAEGAAEPPEPVCPVGVVDVAESVEEEPLPPGASPLDKGLEQLAGVKVSGGK